MPRNPLLHLQCKDREISIQSWTAETERLRTDMRVTIWIQNMVYSIGQRPRGDGPLCQYKKIKVVNKPKGIWQRCN